MFKYSLVFVFIFILVSLVSFVSFVSLVTFVSLAYPIAIYNVTIVVPYKMVQDSMELVNKEK